MYTESDISRFRAEARAWALIVPDEWNSRTDRELARVCNGIGPQYWSDAKRRILTGILFRYESCAAIHDVCYEYRSCSKEEADDAFRRNMLTIWRLTYGWMRWLTHAGRAERAVIEACYAAVKYGGGNAWEAKR